ncbi:MAG: hypothetical protein WAT84_05050 [Candidatus Moraniibacteriota bacterium]
MPTIRLINLAKLDDDHPLLNENAGLIEALDGLCVVVQPDMLTWTVDPVHGNDELVYVRNFELYHALVSRHRAEKAQKLTQRLALRQATAFPITCCDGVKNMLSQLRRGQLSSS